MKNRARTHFALVLLLLAVFGLAALPSTRAGAQGRDAAAKKLEAIRERMEKGQALYLAKKYEEAAREFEQGYQDHPYSAFLFNAGVCYQKLGDADHALEKFREYLRVDPTAPDTEKVKQRIAQLEAAKGATPPPALDAGATVEGGTPEAGTPPPATDAGTPVRPPVDTGDDSTVMKSLVVIETEPDGAPFHVYFKGEAAAGEFKIGAPNTGWRDVATATAPANLTLAVGDYHIVIDKFRDFNVSETDIQVQPGHVYQFKANLSQGAFMAFLRVSANVRGAYIYLDDDKMQKPEWGATPFGSLVTSGKHSVVVEAPGFEPLHMPIVLHQGEQKEVEVKLVRVDFGYLRIESNAPEVRVRIDEEPVGFWRSGEAPLMVKAKAGHHKLTIQGDGRKTYEGMVDVPAGQVLPVSSHMIPKYPRGAAWTQVIIGAAFLGAATYFGLESNRLHDELSDDRKAGHLEEGDGRKTRGTVYAIGADAGFAIGGVLMILSTYNFIKDPLPPSKVKLGTLEEFEDPRKKKPTALHRALGVPRLARHRDAPAPGLSFGPQLGSNAGGLYLGGSF